MKNQLFARHISVGMLALCATFVQASMVAVSHAAEAPSAQAIRISDLDLAKTEDVAKLYRRIHSAAEAVCSSGAITGTRLPAKAQPRCLNEAVDGAIARINKAALWAYHRQETASSKEAGKPGA